MSAVTGSPTPRIRPAQAGDAPALAALLGELGFANRAAELLPRLERMQGEDEDAVLAERDTAVVGLVVLHRMHVLHRPAPVGRITAFVIAEAVRGQGLGSALLDAAERRLFARGCGLIEITSNRRLVQAHAFYEGRGYAFTSHRFAKSAPA